MITKKPPRKQVAIFMNSNNVKKIIAKSNVYIFNINKLLREVKSNILADFINFNNKDIIIITNKVATFSDFNIMEKYVKVMNNIDISNIMSPRLSQSKFYFKILGIPYFVKNTNLPITLDVVATTSHNDLR